MNRLLTYLRGSGELKLTGAAQQLCLNRLARERIPFWDLTQESELEMRICVYRKDIERAVEMARKAQCDAEICKIIGLRESLRRFQKRPVFVAGMLLTVTALLVLPKFVWTVEVVGTNRLEEERIIRELAELNVEFGAWGPALESGELRDELLNRIPELRWCAVNRSGGCVTVPVHEREVKRENQQSPVCNIVAACPGVIEEINILNGFRQCKIGDAVTEGQLLVSGIATWPMGTQAVCAEAEIYALTNRQITAVIPCQTLIKQYAPEEMTCYTLIVGRKRINLSGNSGILHSKCDKITEYKQLILPGGLSFPMALEIEHIRPYETVPVELEEASAESRLLTYAERTVKAAMIAGCITDTQHTMEKRSGCWVLYTSHGCREMIARTVPVPIFGEETASP